MNLPNKVLALQTKLVSTLGKQPYIDAHLLVTPATESPYQIYWYGDNINEATRLNHTSLDQLFLDAHHLLDTMPTEEERERQIFETNLRKLIDEAPAGVDVTLLQTFQSGFASNQIEGPRS